MNIPNWFYDERVQKIAPEKLTLLLKLAEQLEERQARKRSCPVCPWAPSLLPTAEI